MNLFINIRNPVSAEKGNKSAHPAAASVCTYPYLLYYYNILYTLFSKLGRKMRPLETSPTFSVIWDLQGRHRGSVHVQSRCHTNLTSFTRTYIGFRHVENFLLPFQVRSASVLVSPTLVIHGCLRTCSAVKRLETSLQIILLKRSFAAVDTE